MLTVNSIIRRKDSNEGGRIGGFFRFEPGGQIHGITCNHVIANINVCRVGDVLTDIDNNPIGTLTHWLALKDSQNDFTNKAEFALFMPDDSQQPVWKESDPSFRPQGFIAPEVGMKVSFEAGDFQSTGTVTDIAHKISITWNTKAYHFKCVEIKSDGDGPFSKRGHSGGAVYSGTSLLGIILAIIDDKTYVVPFTPDILNFVKLQIV